MAAVLVRRQPDRFVDRMARSLRPGKVLVDWSQNDAGKSTVVAYSLRAMALPTVATPLGWEEIEQVAAGRGRALWFSPTDVLHRVETHGDLFARALDLSQQLPVADLH